MADAFGIKFDPTKALAGLDRLEEQAVNVRPAAQAGAQVLYEEVVLRAPEGKQEQHYFYIRGKKYGPFSKGSLKRSIYQVFSEDNSGHGRATYHVSWNYLKAPYGAMLEYGTSKKPAGNPFLRPAYDAKAKDALEASRARWVQDVQTLISSMQ